VAAQPAELTGRRDEEKQAMGARDSIAIALAALAMTVLAIFAVQLYAKRSAERRAAEEVRSEKIRRIRSRIARLSFARSDEVARTVSEELVRRSALLGSDEVDSSPIIAPHVETRSIMVQAEPDTLDRILRRIAELDVAPPDTPASEGAR